MPLALSSAEKSLSIQTPTHKTVNYISTRCLLACVDNKTGQVAVTAAVVELRHGEWNDVSAEEASVLNFVICDQLKNDEETSKTCMMS